ncbi:hypothetical protein VPNG_00427 [Cytospora leucostoma]|uniref:Uncharacterized protein n=1 Tax=Cytospora leucostoma TaxID=1230097 RepID=A0A423XMW7_9PEZI|nr:hypothetical protein VPNG_00427 [Cytospora leucostoma]
MGNQFYDIDDTGSTLVPEKDAGDYKQPPSWCLRLLCIGPLLLLIWKGRKNRRERRKIEKIRRSIEKDRQRVRRDLDNWDRYRRTWRRRSEAWERGEELSQEQCRAGGFPYNTRYRYRETDIFPSGRTKAQVLDFRTPEGRADALKWYETLYDKSHDAGSSFLGDCKFWEEGYNEYMCTGEKRRDQAGQASLRRRLLEGVKPPVYWVRTISRRMSG